MSRFSPIYHATDLLHLVADRALSPKIYPKIYHASGLLQLITVSDYVRQQPVGYFSLPLEIRTMIMELVLVVGDVILDEPKPRKRDHNLQSAVQHAIKKVSKHDDKNSKLTRIPQPPGFQLLATCKQACAESHAVFYSSNVFFLPSGSVEHARNNLEAIQPQHREMILKLGMGMSVKGLTPAVFEQAYQTMRVRYGNTLTAKPNFVQGEQWGILVAEQLKVIWKQRLHLIAKASVICTELNPRVARYIEEPDAEDTAEIMTFIDAKNDEARWSPEICRHFWYTAKCVREHVEDVVSGEGWKALRKMVNKGSLERTDWYN